MPVAPRTTPVAHSVMSPTLAAALVVGASALPRSAFAEPRWRLDLSARGIASFELGNTQMTDVTTRDGFVPAVGARFERRIGRGDADEPRRVGWLVGGAMSAGFPAYYGKTEAVLSIDRELVVIADDSRTRNDGSAGGTRWLVAAGVDAGVGLLYFDAPPETPSMDDALVYWGPLARARLQLHVLDVLPNTRAVGLVVGANAAITSARYMSPSSGTGLRLEPELELGITMRL
jgi:hypothetical protein